MYVVHEKAFQYSVILSLEIPTKRDLIKVLKKEELKYTIKDVDESIRIIKKDIGNGIHAKAVMVLDPGITLISFYKWRGDATDYGALVHEIFHTVDLNLRAKGITLSDDSDETYAYHLGYFTRELFNKIWAEK